MKFLKYKESNTEMENAFQSTISRARECHGTEFRLVKAKNIYKVDVYIKGKNSREFRQSLHTNNLMLAQQMLNKYNQELHKGTQEESLFVSLENAIELYLSHKLNENQTATYATYKSKLVWFVGVSNNKFQKYTVSDIFDPYFINLLKDAIRKDRKASSARSYARVISSFFKWSQNHFRFPVNESIKEALLDLPKGFTRKSDIDKTSFTEDETLRLLWETKDDILRIRIILHIFCGLRSYEIRNLYWEDLDEKRECITVRKAKGNERDTAPYPKCIHSILNIIRPKGDLCGKTIFPPSSSRDFRSLYRNYLIRLNLTENNPRDLTNKLRRTGARLNERYGGNKTRLGRHQLPNIDEVYRNKDDELKQVNEAWNKIRHLFQASQKKSDTLVKHEKERYQKFINPPVSRFVNMLMGSQNIDCCRDIGI